MSEGGARASGLSDLVLLLPDLTVLLLRLLRDDRVPWGAKAVALAGIGYVFSPLDVMPEILFGPFGLIDDLVVVCAALSRLMNRVHPDVVRSHWPGRQDALDHVHELTDWAESRIRDTLRSLTRTVFRRHA